VGRATSRRDGAVDPSFRARSPCFQRGGSRQPPGSRYSRLGAREWRPMNSLAGARQKSSGEPLPRWSGSVGMGAPALRAAHFHHWRAAFENSGFSSQNAFSNRNVMRPAGPNSSHPAASKMESGAGSNRIAPMPSGSVWRSPTGIVRIVWRHRTICRCPSCPYRTSSSRGPLRRGRQ